MVGLVWTISIWAVTLFGLNAFTRRPMRLTNLHLATVALLLGSHIFQPDAVKAINATADPLSTESVARGALLAVALVLVAPDLVRLRFARRSPAMWSLTIYACVALLSAIYSISAVTTAGKAIELLIAVVIVWAMCGRREAEQELKSTVRLIIILETALIVVAVAGFFLMPETFAERQGRAAFLFENTAIAPFLPGNTLGASGALVAVYGTALVLTARTARIRLRWGVLAAVAAFAVVLASTRQGAVFTALSLAVLLVVTRRRYLLWWLAAGAVGVLVWGEAVLDRLTRGQSDAVLSTLSGRTPRWERAWDVFVDHPIRGVGYTMGRLAEGTGPLHSGYLEVLVGVGLIGLIPFALTLARVIAWSSRGLVRRGETPLAILVVPLVLYTAVSTGFGAQANSAFMIFALFAALADRAPPPVRRAAELQMSGRVSAP